MSPVQSSVTVGAAGMAGAARTVVETQFESAETHVTTLL
jgi:hypothetical protein